MRSKFEQAVYDAAIAEGHGMIYEDPEARLLYSVPHVYLPDFIMPNGIRVECKGFFSPEDRRKMLAVRNHNRKMDIRFVFQNARNRLTKSKNSRTYGQWCDQHGFKWAEGRVPKAWFYEYQ